MSARRGKPDIETARAEVRKWTPKADINPDDTRPKGSANRRRVQRPRSNTLFSVRDIRGENPQEGRPPGGFPVVAIRDHRICHCALEIIVPERAGQIAGMNP